MAEAGKDFCKAAGASTQVDQTRREGHALADLPVGLQKANPSPREADRVVPERDKPGRCCVGGDKQDSLFDVPALILAVQFDGEVGQVAPASLLCSSEWWVKPDVPKPGEKQAIVFF